MTNLTNNSERKSPLSASSPQKSRRSTHAAPLSGFGVPRPTLVVPRLSQQKSTASPVDPTTALTSQETPQPIARRDSPAGTSTRDLKLALSPTHSRAQTQFSSPGSPLNSPHTPSQALLISPRTVASHAASATLYQIEVKPANRKIFPAQPQEKTPGYLSRTINFFRRCLRRPKDLCKARLVTVLALSLNGVTLFFWINEEIQRRKEEAEGHSEQNQAARSARLAFITTATGALFRFNLASFGITQWAVEGIDRLVQSFAFPVIILEQGAITSLYGGDWDSPAAQSLVLGLAGSFTGVRLDRSREGFSVSASVPLEEIEYSHGFSTTLNRTQIAFHFLEFATSISLIVGGLLWSESTHDKNEKFFANAFAQFGVAQLTATTTRLILERSSRFRRMFTVRAATLCTLITNSFFPLFIRPAAAPEFGVLVGALLGMHGLAQARVLRHWDYMHKTQSAMMADFDQLFPHLRIELETALNEPRSKPRTAALVTEGQPINVLSRRGKKAALGISYVVAASCAYALIPAYQAFSLLLIPSIYTSTRYVQLNPREFYEFCKREIDGVQNGSSLTYWQKTRLWLDRTFCKNPTLIGMLYTISLRIWDSTRIDAFSFAIFCTMTGMYYALENRSAYLPPDVLARMEKAFQIYYCRLSPEQRKLLPGKEEDYREKLGITDAMLLESPIDAPAVDLSYQQAACLQLLFQPIERSIEPSQTSQQPLPSVVSTQAPRIFKVNAEEFSSDSAIAKAAVTGCYSGDLAKAVLKVM